MYILISIYLSIYSYFYILYINNINKKKDNIITFIIEYIYMILLIDYNINNRSIYNLR